MPSLLPGSVPDLPTCTYLHVYIMVVTEPDSPHEMADDGSLIYGVADYSILMCYRWRVVLKLCLFPQAIDGTMAEPLQPFNDANAEEDER